ncbi:uncharacterized protein LOC126833039 [Adelges cooleyi]|uniref:uncharacterized protein LOC126833039 n=1 Tax=Adelges cooleyi TaxID=133065 RepID=UPI002180580E|nr:uncharacterized protein LOC126833039 [Adelges cooleyi]
MSSTLSDEEHESQPTFGRHEAHKHHDTMGEIVGGDAENVDLQFNEVNLHPETLNTLESKENGNSAKGDLDNDPSTFGTPGHEKQEVFGRHAAHKHHDTMGKIIQGDGAAANLKSEYCQNDDIKSSVQQDQSICGDI